MKNWSDLTDTQKAWAENHELNRLLEDVVSGAVRFNDEANEDDLQARIDAAGEKANSMQTPWYWSEYIMEDEKVRESLEGMARRVAEDALYAEPHEYVINLPGPAND